MTNQELVNTFVFLRETRAAQLDLSLHALITIRPGFEEALKTGFDEASPSIKSLSLSNSICCRALLESTLIQRLDRLDLKIRDVRVAGDGQLDALVCACVSNGSSVRHLECYDALNPETIERVALGVCPKVHLNFGFGANNVLQALNGLSRLADSLRNDACSLKHLTLKFVEPPGFHGRVAPVEGLRDAVVAFCNSLIRNRSLLEVEVRIDREGIVFAAMSQSLPVAMEQNTTLVSFRVKNNDSLHPNTTFANNLLSQLEPTLSRNLSLLRTKQIGQWLEPRAADDNGYRFIVPRALLTHNRMHERFLLFRRYHVMQKYIENRESAELQG